MAEEKAKKGFKMPSSFTVLFIIIGLMAILTWFVPAGQYETNEEGVAVDPSTITRRINSFIKRSR